MPGAAIHFAKPLVAFPPGQEFRLADGWWMWATAATLLAAAFVVLPPPDRPEAGEDLPPGVVHAARTRMAIITAGGGIAGMVSLWHSFRVPEVYTFAVGTRVTVETPFPRGSAFDSMLQEPLWFLALYLAVPFAFAAALRWRRLRSISALAAAGAICAILIVRKEGYWDITPQDPAPLALAIWCLVPAAFLVASFLLPPQRFAGAERDAVGEGAGPVSVQS
jgi:hypothetical protein